MLGTLQSASMLALRWARAGLCAPDDETMAKHVLAVGAGGNVRIITLKAFPEEVYRSIIADL